MGDPLDELALPPKRWTTRRKAAVVEAVRGGKLTLQEACERYQLSADEFLAWERAIERHGAPGLRATRVQIYRETEKPRRS
jgi:transposase-like protein